MENGNNNEYRNTRLWTKISIITDTFMNSIKDHITKIGFHTFCNDFINRIFISQDNISIINQNEKEITLLLCI